LRPIKFRAWDEEKKRMVYGVESAYDTISKIFDGTGKELDWYDDTSFCHLSSFGCFIDHNVPLMQFTGLTDKNGREIYEGDIVRDTHFSDAFDIVEWDSSCFEPFFREDTLWFCDITTVEVVGNRWENPELLKKPTP
jgi:uncharacterized phage protein (TIGR01671 family)